MALQFTPSIASMTVEAGEAVAFEYQLKDLEGSVRDLTGRAFRLTLYNTGTRTSYFSQDGSIGTDENGGHFIQWVSDGSLTENLIGKTNIYFEIAERLNQGKNVLSEGTVDVKQSAPDVPSFDSAPIARFVWRIVRTCDGSGSATPIYTKTRVALVPVTGGGNGGGGGTPNPTITLKALALSTTSFTAAGGFSASILNSTSGSSIAATSSDGTALNVTGTTLTGTFASAGNRTVALTETLAGATNSPLTTSIPVTVAAAPKVLAALSLSSTAFTTGAQAVVSIVGATTGSTLTATSSDGTTLTVNGTTISGTFQTSGSPTITLSETLAGATNSPRSSTISVAVSAAAKTLTALGLSATTFVAGTQSSATITGTTAGSTLSATSSDGTVLTVNGATLTGTFTATGVITITLVETLTGATNTPRISGIQASVTASQSAPSNPNLNSDAAVYGDPGTVFPLSIRLVNPATSYTLAVPDGLPVASEQIVTNIVPVSSQWATDAVKGAKYTPTGNAVDTSIKLVPHGTTSTKNGHVLLTATSWLDTAALGWSFPQTTDPTTTQTPPSIRVGYKGAVTSDTSRLIELQEYGIGLFKLAFDWNGSVLLATLGRDDGIESVYSDASTARKLNTNQLYEMEWTDNPGAAGGTLKFYIDGVQMGASKPTTSKPKITPNMGVSTNASLGNTSGAVAGMEVQYLAVAFGKANAMSSYVPVASGSITPDKLQTLVIDARSVSANQASKALTYVDNNGVSQTLNVIVGPMTVPAGQPYKAVLEDWSSGAAVAHANELVMTKPAAQNVRFEDTTLNAQQPAWTELLPRGPVPTINGINYYCEAIRIGTYATFQFGYDWSPTYMPNVPFGDPSADGGKETYMVPHKWKIYDSTGALLGTVQKPDGGPLNGTDTKPIWEGTYDGRNVAMVTDANKPHPHGTVRSGIIWRTSDPAAYTQSEIYNQMPTYDFRVPFAMQTGYSVNGFDLRLYTGGAGGDGQSNGFGNYRWMSWEPTTYQGITNQAAATLNPYKTGANAIGVTPNAGIWLKYTPFNITGRGPISGPGGTRDDRQVMPEPVARYARDVTSKRLHDNRSMKDIALSYLTGYVSDPVHTVENGRLTPLFKGAPRRPITMRNHYYGYGEGSTPTSQAYYVQGGRMSDWTTQNNPLKVVVPYAGKTADKPYFGTFQIDDDHSEFYPHWGSMMFKTPEFAMIGHRFGDQARLYSNKILADGMGEVGVRGAAWKYLHAALAWKTGSAGSTRLYNRAEILDWVTFDFESAYTTWYSAATNSVKNPPTNLMSGGAIDQDAVLMASLLRFGPTFYDNGATYCHDFQAGYWLQALHVAEKNGFNAALRAASAKAGELLDWMVSLHTKRIVGRLLDGYLINAQHGTEYLTPYWTDEQITAVNGDLSQLPQTFAAVQAAQDAATTAALTWDTYTWEGDTGSRDGQAMDQLLAGPGLLKDMGVTDARLQTAYDTAETRFQSKLTAETAKGADAGSGWFLYHQATCNRPYKPS